MKINKVTIRNFYSIKSLSLAFDKYDGVVLVEGKNKDAGGSNGSGKSAIFEAVVWGLFGRTIRKSNEEAMVNIKAKKDCYVELLLNDNTVIKRSRRPSSLSFFIGDNNLTKESMLETQRCVEDSLKINYKTFLASLVFGQHNDIDFVSSSPDDRRNIIKNFLNLEELFIYKDKAKKLKASYNQEIKSNDALIKEYLSNISDIKVKLSTLRSEIKTWGDVPEDIEAISLEEIIDREGVIARNSFTIGAIEKEVGALKDRQDYLSCLVTEGERELTDLCDKCGNISVKKVTSMDLDSWDQEIGTIESEIKRLNTKIEGIKAEEKPVPISSKNYVKYLKYKELVTKEDSLKERKEEYESRLEHIEEEKIKFLTNYEVMKFWDKAFSEQGLIKYIIKNILGFLNKKTNFYLSNLTNGKYIIKFDEELHEEIIHRKSTLSYISLSGGERRKINLAVMLGLQSLLSMTKENIPNILFFDEIAENLDEEGLNGLYILIQELKKTKAVFIITHNKYFKSLFDSANTISITKRNGISSLARS